MKCLIIGGNRSVGLRVANALDAQGGVDLSVLNRTGQAAHCKNAAIYKGDRNRLEASHLDRDWDLILDFACFHQSEAEGALQYFKNVGRYIFISTMSVYDPGANLSEDAFDARAWDLKKPAVSPPTYQDGKRRAEAAFEQAARFPVLSVRFPFILGPDDYTHRLDFHIDRARRAESIYVPNPQARFSMIHSADAADFILWALERNSLSGPLNVASPDSISLSGLLGQIELVTGIKPILAKKESADNHSPYARDEDCVANTARLRQAGFKARAIADWLPGLIGKPTAGKPRFVH